MPCPVQGSRPVGDWVPSTLPGNPADPLSTNNNNNPRDQELELDDSDQARLLARTKKNLRAVLTAVKGELELSRLEQEYYETFEENIPWQSLSFASLGEMLEAMPRVCEVKNVMFSTYVSAVLDHNTDHIRQMVNCQKKSKKNAGKGQWRQWRPAHDYHEYNFQTEEEESYLQQQSMWTGRTLRNRKIFLSMNIKWPLRSWRERRDIKRKRRERGERRNLP